MNKNYKIITINGIRGMLIIAFIIMGLIAGFVVSPAWVCMKLWNMYIVKVTSVPAMSLYQGFLMWFVIALSLYALNKDKTILGIGTYTGLTQEQLNKVLNRTKKLQFKTENEIKKIQEEIKIESCNKSESNADIESSLEQTEKEKEKEEIRG